MHLFFSKVLNIIFVGLEFFFGWIAYLNFSLIFFWVFFFWITVGTMTYHKIKKITALGEMTGRNG